MRQEASRLFARPQMAEWAMGRNTVLGASGFIGSNLAKVIDPFFAPTRKGLYMLKGGDLGRVFYCLGDDAGAVEPNLGYLLWFLRNCQFKSLVYLSSTRVYLGASSGDEHADLVLSPHDPGYQFNVIKLAAEAACIADPRCKVVRLSTVVGPNKAGYLIPGLIKDARNGTMNLRLPAWFVRDLITIEDVVELLPKIHTGKHRIYNLASGVDTTIGEIVWAIERATGSGTNWEAYRPDSTFPSISISRIMTEFGFTPRPTLPAIRELCK